MVLQLEGRSLLTAVTTLTCLGFLLIGFDNGLMGGLVNSAAFKGTFHIVSFPDTPEAYYKLTIIGSQHKEWCERIGSHRCHLRNWRVCRSCMYSFHG
jgi:hypothetical protein